MGLSLGRVIGAGIFFVLVGWLAPLPCGADQVWPSTHWAKADDPAALGWSTEKLTKAEEYTRTYSPTAVVIIQDGKVIASWGDSSHKVNVRSVRKSLLSALCGIGVAEGRIRLDETVGELGIDDRAPGLSETEKQANIRDLLIRHLSRRRLRGARRQGKTAAARQSSSGRLLVLQQLGLQRARLHLSEAGGQQHLSRI